MENHVWVDNFDMQCTSSQDGKMAYTYYVICLEAYNNMVEIVGVL
jgi:hypothetical protein